jgi:predicted type IV restriction endonuclease
MAKQKLDKEVRKAILDARKLIDAVAQADGNEAETRRRVERIFESLMGYDVLKHVTREHAVHGVGDTEHCDFAIQLDNEESSVPQMLVELKRVNINLVPKHLKQVTSYAINMGCEWSLLTNGKEWKLYHISFTQPPQIKLIASWNLINDDPVILAEKFALIGYKNIKRDGLAQIWERANVLTAHNILKAIISEDSIKLIRRSLKKATDVTVSPEEIVGAVRRMLNESALGEIERIKISLPDKKRRKRKSASKSTKEPQAQLAEEDNHVK